MPSAAMEFHRPLRSIEVPAFFARKVMPLFSLLLLFPSFLNADQKDPDRRMEREIAPLFKKHCVRCHGPIRREGGVDLSTPQQVARGNEEGPVILSHDLEGSRLWKLIETDQMPPKAPLGDPEKKQIRDWILAGAPGLYAERHEPTDEHWAFRTLTHQITPPHMPKNRHLNWLDAWLDTESIHPKIQVNPQAERGHWLRRVSFSLTGLPPSIDDVEEFLADQEPDAYERMVDRYLASPEYGVRWGKYWLDAVGYADSNGYFNADSDRPLAYRYRDYVVRSLQNDKPFDQFLKEQLAGDEMAHDRRANKIDESVIELLEATHFLRNGQDGSGESDGNPDEVRADRYYALESAMQNTASALLGLTIQCAKCHDHKFEPITQRDYYRWQALFYPTFHIEHWVKPKDRFTYAPLPEEQLAWETKRDGLIREIDLRKAELKEWVGIHRVRGEVLFEDTFVDPDRLREHWSTIAPGDDSPGGTPPVAIGGDASPAARIEGEQLKIIEGTIPGDRWLSTKAAFDWTPDQVGESIQVTFDLVDHRLDSQGVPATRIGYFIALHDFDDNSAIEGGNILIDGHPSDTTSVHLDYPGSDSKQVGSVGKTGYAPGHRYGVRISNQGKGKFRLEHLVDSMLEEKSLELSAKDLPDGGFGFEYCCGRSFIVDNVLVERIPADPRQDSLLHELKERRDSLSKKMAELKSLEGNRPGKIAWAADMSSQIPVVHLLDRGNYSARSEVVPPGTLSLLQEPTRLWEVPVRTVEQGPLGWRLSWASWLTQRDTRSASLLARVQANRVWQYHFGKGIVATPENLGLSGAPPSHPELLDWLATEFIRSGWSLKSLHRIILLSDTYRRSSSPISPSQQLDPENLTYWRFPMHRLDAEALRDSMLDVSGDLNRRLGGPYVPTARNESGEVLPPDSDPGAFRRSIYLYQRRTQVTSFLSLFDAPSIVFNSVRRNRSTMPLQALTLLNSEFVLKRAEGMATLIEIRMRTGDSRERIAEAYRRAYSRSPLSSEVDDALTYLEEQSKILGDQRKAWNDFCHALISSNEFLYVE